MIGSEDAENTPEQVRDNSSWFIDILKANEFTIWNRVVETDRGILDNKTSLEASKEITYYLKPTRQFRVEIKADVHTSLARITIWFVEEHLSSTYPFRKESEVLVDFSTLPDEPSAQDSAASHPIQEACVLQIDAVLALFGVSRQQMIVAGEQGCPVILRRPA